ncbi:MAG: hypothetical protein IAI49_05180 [Candidatus Eremiobacteraeota bacterium]|nr:hypothetical protein [Candidatus Eremiobacteraeota bacterium]
MNDSNERDENGADTESEADRTPAADDPSLTEYDKTLADSFPSSDPPAQP